MKKWKQGLRDNGIFFALVVAVVLAGVIISFQNMIGQNPFDDELYMDAPVQAVLSSDASYFVVDSGSAIVITDSDGKIIRRVSGGDNVTSFSVVKEVVPGENGTFYVLDREYSDDEVTSAKERILEFTGYGRICRVLYEAETADRPYVQHTILCALNVVEGQVKLCRIDESGITCCSLIDGELLVEKRISYPGANTGIYDLAHSNSGAVAAITMNGKLLLWKVGEDKPQEHPAFTQLEKGYELLTEACFDGETLYLNDSGKRCIYQLTDEGLKTVLDASVLVDSDAPEIYEVPLLSGISASDGRVTAMVSDYSFSAELDEHIYSYKFVGVDSQGEFILDTDTVATSASWRFDVCLVYVCILLAVALAVATVVLLVRMLRSVPEKRSHMQLILLLSIITVSFLVGLYVFELGTERLVGTYTDNLASTGRLLRTELSVDDLRALDTPDSFDTEAYSRIDDTVARVLHYGRTVSDSIYAVIYRVEDNVLYEAYRNAGAKPVLYPLAGGFEGSEEMLIAETGELYTVNGLATSEGTFSYVDIPVYDEDGQFVALLEIGESYTAITKENDALLRAIMIRVFMFLIIVMLLFTEIIAISQAWKSRKRSVAQHHPLPPEIIRPIAFFTFFTANITTVFLPIYSMSLWTESFPMQQEIAAALPLSAELIMGAVFSLLCGRWLRKWSPKKLCSIGAAMYIGGNLLSAVAQNLWMLIGANSMCGIGSGLILVSVNTWIAQQQDEHSQNQGFIHYNAAYLSGMNCGSVVGAVVWELFGIRAAYATAGLCGMMLLLAVRLYLDNTVKAPAVEEKTASVLRLFSPRVIRYFLFLTVPYLVCASFLSYFFPIIGEQNHLSASEISMAFLLSGIISIYVGAEIGDPLVEKLGVKRSMILASFIYVVALSYLVYRPQVSSCYVVIVLFAIADSFGLAAQSVYFANLDEVKLCGEGRALAVNSTIESITAACGSLIFGAALLMGYRMGIFVIDVILALFLVAFLFGERMHDRKKTAAPAK